MAANDKALAWLRGEVKTPPFGNAARIEAGVLLRQLQRGENLSLPHSRPMPSIGSRSHELRIQDEDKSWRIIYRIESDAVVILEVFRKTKRQTPLRIIADCKRRLKQYE